VPSGPAVDAASAAEFVLIAQLCEARSVGRTDSGRAVDVMDAIVTAGWRLSFGDRLIRRYGVAAAAALGIVAAVLGSEMKMTWIIRIKRK